MSSTFENKPLTIQRGVGLIEVLITLFVISVGVMGMLGMQVTAKRANLEAVQRSQAVALAQDILERIRNNPTALDAYLPATAGSPVIGGGKITGITMCGDGASCTAEQLAKYDLYEWEQSVDGAAAKRDIDADGTSDNVGGLLNPAGCIANVAGVVTVTIAWEGFQSLSVPATSDCGKDTMSDETRRQVLSITTFVSSS